MVRCPQTSHFLWPLPTFRWVVVGKRWAGLGRGVCVCVWMGRTGQGSVYVDREDWAVERVRVRGAEEGMAKWGKDW